MPYCPNCGTELTPDIKFCTECGQCVDDTLKNAVRKCPNCGEEINTTCTVCPYCNYEFRNIEQSVNLRMLTDNLEAIEKERKTESGVRTFFAYFGIGKANETSVKKAAAIESFAVPDSQQELYDFILLAISNIDVSVLGFTPGIRSASINLNNIKSQKKESAAWYKKLLEAYQKACLLYKTEDSFSVISEIYRSKARDIKLQKIRAAVFGTIKTVIGIIVFLIIAASALFLMRLMLLFMGI